MVLNVGMIQRASRFDVGSIIINSMYFMSGKGPRIPGYDSVLQFFLEAFVHFLF